MASNPLVKLEHVTRDKARANALKEELEELKDTRDQFWEDDFSRNQLLRKRFRVCWI
jgi:hypothetical protein